MALRRSGRRTAPMSSPTAERSPVKTPQACNPHRDGVIGEVLRPLNSGKEATVYLVRSGTQVRCAKVYRDMTQRSFQKRAQYQERLKVRGSRQRAIGEGTRFGRKEPAQSR